MLPSQLQPARLLTRAIDPLFRRIDVDGAWLEAIQAAAARGPVVYVLRNVSALDFLALSHLTHRLDLPRIGFVNGLAPALRPAMPWAAQADEERLRHTIEAGHSAALFVKRAPHRIGAAPRGRRQSGALLATLLKLQAERPECEIMMMPQTFLWSQRPERTGFSWVDTIFGPGDFPGELRTTAQYLLNFTNGKLRAGEPLSVREFLAQAQGEDSTEARISRLTDAVLRKVEQERRSIVGPATKSPIRLREEVLRNTNLQTVVAELAGPSQKGRRLLTDKARAILRRMQSVPDADVQRTMAAVVVGIVENVFSGLDIDMEGLARLREATRRGPVVLLPSHKSHIDYLVLSTMLRRHAVQLPVIASGENLSFFPAGPILRRGGAFFIRRRFHNDRLYSAVVDAYIRRLLRDGWMIEFFLEGGRSRTGKLLPPRTGLLSMVVSAALQLEGQHVTFMPVSIGYERLMEEESFERELSGQKKSREDATALLRASELLLHRWGRVNIQFGEAVELAPVREAVGATAEPVAPELQQAVVTRLAHQVMSEINRVTALTPGSLVSMVLLAQERRGLAYEDLLAHCRRLTALMLRRGARATPSLLPPGGDQIRIRAIRELLKLYLRNGLVQQHVPGEGLTTQRRKPATLHTGSDVIFTVPGEKRLRLDLAKNTVLPFIIDRALIATALLGPSAPPPPAPLDDGERASEPPPPPSGPRIALPLETLRARVLSLSRLFKYEFMFRVDASFDEIFDEAIGEMVDVGELGADDGTICIGPGHDGLDGRGWVGFYAASVRNFLESYRVAARALLQLMRGPMTDKDLAARALRVGERMFLEGEIERSEAVCRPPISNALKSFCDQGYLVRDAKELKLSRTFRSDEAAQAIEARIAAYLPRRSDEA